ncbi:FadR/GntR family transcriptional regulator [Microvirga roseola]|uniref:FadR/GntR family transcriptional regulator n=1 Tax=Microvirga roseola TaxID=2883126 RepID=UPI001E28E083|nr:FCD domain-containing protein [Microvirga roseola]
MLRTAPQVANWGSSWDGLGQLAQLLGRVSIMQLLDRQGLWAEIAASSGNKGRLIAALEEAIRNGMLPRGARLPTEREIAEATGLSRNTVRDAFSRLTERGLIARQVGRGTFVNLAMKEPELPLHENGQVRLPSPRELVEFRAECEPTTAMLIVMNASDAELMDIEQLALKGREALTWDQSEANDAEFHSRLYEATGNSVFQHIGCYLRQVRRSQAWMSLKQQTFSLERWRKYQQEHELIVTALRSRDVRGSREALRNHLSRVQGWVDG